MTDLNKEREAFEKLSEIAEILNEEKSHFNGDFYDLPFNSCAESFINGAWYAWQEKAKAQAVQQSFEIGRLQDRITELLDERQDLYAQINNDQAVPEGYVLVPKEIPDSVVSCLENSGFHWGDGTRDHYTPIYSLMVEVASESGAEQ